MNDARRQKILKVMAVVLVAFGGSLFYFLFFNSGLALAPDPTDQAGHVLVMNDSVHAIHNITFSYLVEGKESGAQSVSVLLPRESVSMSLDNHYLDGSNYLVQVRAPYHISRQINIQTSNNIDMIPALSISFESPSFATQNNPVLINLIARNLDPIPRDVRASFDWTIPSSGENPPVQEWGLPPNGEGSLALSATPFVASDNLSFKIKVFTPSNVLVEREYSLQVLPDPDANVNISLDENTMNNADSNSVVDVNGSDS